MKRVLKTIGWFLVVLYAVVIPLIGLMILGVVFGGLTADDVDSLGDGAMIIGLIVAFVFARRYWKTGKLRKTEGSSWPRIKMP